ncbi:unnamed protein product [Strongylus vulgaris]|uniref:Large ribosomal subunit protein mL49 n=1 Tax=Strongylus vulgaris TaxID=40348 RepID=A0A3P7IHY5_STRVU|nr:unnamed protein product [Strongylus vulgaris]
MYNAASLRFSRLDTSKLVAVGGFMDAYLNAYIECSTTQTHPPPKVFFCKKFFFVLDPPPDLPYYVRRKRDHMLPLYLSRRRDLLNEKTLDFDYVELVTMKNVEGDVFACEKDLREFVEEEVGKPIGTHVDELKGRIVIKGVDRSLVEKFLFTKGF